MRIQWIMTLISMAVVSISAPINYPHLEQNSQSIHGAFAQAPKTLDPARAYSSDEIQIIAQIYEPVLQYHYLKRPYQLTTLTAQKMPKISHQKIPDKNITTYTIAIKPGIFYAPHPGLAKQDNGRFWYHELSKQAIAPFNQLSQFKHQGTRELQASDYVYEIKRLADPRLHSPIFGFLSDYIVGLKDYRKTLSKALKNPERPKPHWYLNLRHYPLPGVTVLDRYHFQIHIKGNYPQFKYWLAMTFFSPIPWEVDYFYAQPGMKEKNFSFDWQPIGTGPFMLIENNPNKAMILTKNPMFHPEFFPSNGEKNDRHLGYLQHAGQRLPLVDRYELSLDKESIPRWNKFLQGYYDHSGIGADSFDQAIAFDRKGQPILSQDMKQRGIKLTTAIAPSIHYIGFNMLDDIVGGSSQRAKYLRQAIAIALNYEEYIQIFLNGRGIAAQGPIPPGITGYDKKVFNPIVYHQQEGRIQRQDLAEAKRLMKKSGYPDGIDPKTGKALILHYDVAGSNSPDDRARFDWMRKQFAKLGIELNIRSTLYNRFQQKMRQGQAQLFSWGWNADYPDPENFLFLLYGPNGKAKHGGENAANYNNPKFDQLFAAIKKLPEGKKRRALIQQSIQLVQQDSPWIFGLHPIHFSLAHQWISPSKPNPMANNTLKYKHLNAPLRQRRQQQWNRPKVMVLWLLLIFALILLLPLLWHYHHQQRRPSITRYNKNKPNEP